MPKFTKTAPSETQVVTEDQFKILPVISRSSIKDFVTKHGITFAPGRGFYQLTKPETIQAHKEIIAVRISDGAKVTGDALRELLKIPSGAAKFKYTHVDDFEVYVQSMSYNRVLMPNTKFLYEVTPSAKGSSSVKRNEVSVNQKKRVAVNQKKRVAVNQKKRVGAPPPVAPGSPIDLVFSFDTTESMDPFLDEARKNLITMIERILKDIPNIRIAVFAHGDHDTHLKYVTKFVDFTSDKKKLVDFVSNVEPATGGYTFEECYELVLQEVRTKLSWLPGSQRALVMIGDAFPHSVSAYKALRKKFSFIKSAIDWKRESDALIGIGCRVYAVQCMLRSYKIDQCTKFWAEVAFRTYGHHLELSSFSNLLDFIMAIAYKEQGSEQFEAYRQEVIKRASGGEGMNADLHALFNSLDGGDDDDNVNGGTAGAVAASAFSVTSSAIGKRKASNVTGTTASKKPKSSSMAVKNATAKPAAAKLTPAKKAPAKKISARKASAKTTSAKKISTKKAPTAQTASRKKPSAKKTPAKRATARTLPVKKARGK